MTHWLFYQPSTVMTMQQEPGVSVVHHPQGRVVGNRIIYNSDSSCLSGLNCCLCYHTKRGKIILAFILSFYLVLTIFGFAVGIPTLGLVFFGFFLFALLICVWNYYRWKTQSQTQQSVIQSVNYSQGPPQQAPGPYHSTAYPPYPQQYPPQNYPGQTPSNYPPYPPYAAPYTTQNHPFDLHQASRTVQAQPGQTEEPPPPSYEDVMKGSR